MRQIPSLDQAFKGAKSVPEVIRNQIGLLNLEAKSNEITIFTRRLELYYSYITDKTLLKTQREFFEGFYHEIDEKYPDILFRLEGRRKSFISAYKKLWRADSYATMKDISGFRITLFGDDSEKLIKQCYTVMDLLFNYSLNAEEVEPCMATPLKDTKRSGNSSLLSEDIQPYVKDYIHNPKENGYQSLHMIFQAKLGYYFEVQIRTFDMHMHAEYGQASHSVYKKKYDELEFDRSLVNIPGYCIIGDKLYDWVGLEESQEILRRQKTF